MFQFPMPEEPSVKSCRVSQCLVGTWQHTGQRGVRWAVPSLINPRSGQRARQLSCWVSLPSPGCPLCPFVPVTAEDPLMALIVSSPRFYHCLPSQLCLSILPAHSPHPKGKHPWAALAFCWAGWAAQRLGGTRASQGKGRGLALAFVAGTHASSPEPAWLVFLLKQRFKL